MAEKQVPINQTQFSFEEPIFENQAVYMEDKPEDPDQKAKDKKKKIIIGAVLGILLIIIAILLLLVINRKPAETIQEEVANEVVTKELGPLQKRIEDARELLELADPSKQDLAFPPIDLEIRLDKKEK